MDYKWIIKTYLEQIPDIKPRELVRFSKYYIEYLRVLAKSNWIDPTKEYRWTNKVIEIYTNKWYACVGNIIMLLDMYISIATISTHYKDYDTIMKIIISEDELKEFKCLLEILS